MNRRPTTSPTRPRRGARALAVLAAGAALVAVPTASGAGSASATGTTTTTAAATASCSTSWGSLAKTSAPLARGRVTGVRAGRHACFDRLVLDMTGRAPGYDVRYVTAVTADGSGHVVPVAGGARLAVVAKKGATVIPSMPSVAGFTTFRQVKWAGAFEGYTTVGLGVRARLPFRVFTLYDATTNRSKLVVDVAHRW
ncbi:hypothetical protein [Oryzobacter telluris]|uniref:AMIN-like domain-containing (lipo)protein n=1 Tax=Oryzobacter telluris TaxID=3149179 RepID=UPI00370D1458